MKYNKILLYPSVIRGVGFVKLCAPLFAQFELTSRCQNQCFFCYNIWKDCKEKQFNNLTKKEIWLILHKLLDCQLFSLIFSGGEPTLCFYLPEAIELIASYGVEVIIITNGLRFAQSDYSNRLADSGLDSIQLSLHHFVEEKNDLITQNPGSYRLAVRGISNILNVFGDQRISVNMVVTKSTFQDVYDMGSFLNGLGIKQFTVSMVSYSGQAVKNELIVGRLHFLAVYKQLIKLHQDLRLEVGLVGGMPLCIIPELDGVVRISNTCDAAINQIVIGPDGGIRPCVEWPHSVGSALMQDIKEVWTNSPELNMIREFRNTPKSCHKCNLVSICHGGCRASAFKYSGNITGNDPILDF